MTLLSRRRWPIIPVIVVGSLLLAYQLGSRAHTPPTPEAPREYAIDGLVVPADALHFGEVWEEKDFTRELPIHNRTAAEIRVRDFVLSCGCMEAKPRSVTVPAGGTVAIQLKLDLTRRSQGELGQSERPVAFQITPVLGPNPFPQGPSWVLRGTVKSRLTLDAQGLHFGEMGVQEQPPPRLKVRATAHVPFDRLEVRIDPEVAVAEVRPDPEDARKFEVFLSPDTALPPGPFQAKVFLDLATAAGERLPGVTLPITGQVRPAIRLLPARVFLSSAPVGETAEAVVVLQAPPGDKIAVDQVETDSPDVRVQPVAAEGVPAGRAFRVTQRMTEPGDRTSIVRFIVRKGGRERQILSVEVCSRGEAVGSHNRKEGSTAR